MNAPFPSLAEGGSRSPLRLIPMTAAQWTHEREQEAREAGYRVEYRHERGMLIASFFNGPYHCYDREHVL